ncbi:MAG: hypothetical protein QOD71_1728 [Thermoleophilaceae bacterium]|jgi:hypothetical protein|nr:hypothetical protein [Thermoleophilaceae bacterium]
MARVSLHSPDLLFGSKVEGALRAAGHEVVRTDDGEVAVVDLTTGEVPAPPAGVPTVAYYLHTDQDTRQRAEAAGYDIVVPRSRMNREAVQLVEKLLEP